MALFCKASLAPLSGATLLPQRSLHLQSLRSTAKLSLSRCSPTLVQCQASTPNHPSSQRITGNLFKSTSASTSLQKASPYELTLQAAEDSKPGLIPDNIKDAIMTALQHAWKPAVISLLIAAIMFNVPAGDALAAQGGGRVGGKSGFSASRSRSYSAPAQSYRAPSTTIIAPSIGYSAPFFAPSPFFFPFFGPTVVVGGGGGGGSLFTFILLGIVAAFVVSAVLNLWGGSQTEEEEMWEASQRSSVIRLQVGLLGNARQLQKDLERIATRADTGTPEGLHYVLSEAVLSLLRNPDFCIYGYSTSEVTRDSYEGEQAFNRLSLEERSKFREETLVNVGDVRRRIDRTIARETVGSEYIVVTLIAATEGEFTIPEVKSQADLRSALTTLGSITADELQAVEILWTPENEEDTLTTKDLLQDYPLLRPL